MTFKCYSTGRLRTLKALQVVIGQFLEKYSKIFPVLTRFYPSNWCITKVDDKQIDISAYCLHQYWFCSINPDGKEFSAIVGKNVPITVYIDDEAGQKVVNDIFKTLQWYTNGQWMLSPWEAYPSDDAIRAYETFNFEEIKIDENSVIKE